MCQQEIYNFDHGFDTPGQIHIDNFVIEISQEHCDNLNKLERGASHKFKHDNDKGFYVERTDPVHGSYVVTAVLSYLDSDVIPSVLYEEKMGNTNIDDLCATLSALTGRLVFLKKAIDSRPSVTRFDGMVSSSHFSRNRLSLNGLYKIKSDGLETAFLNLCYAPTARDLLSLSAYANAILNAMYEEWCSRNSGTKYPQVNEVKQVLSKISQIVKAELTASGVEESTCADIVARMRFESSPSAIYKISSFLRGVGITDSTPQDVAEKHIKWINTVRNRLTHAGGIPKSSDLGYEQMADISVHIVFIVITLAQWYFADKYLGISNGAVVRDKLALTEYFSSGIFQGKKIFEETYEEYMARMIEDWISLGGGAEA